MDSIDGTSSGHLGSLRGMESRPLVGVTTSEVRQAQKIVAVFQGMLF